MSFLRYMVAGAAALSISLGAGHAATLAPGGVVNPVAQVNFADLVHGGTQAVVEDGLLPFFINPSPDNILGNGGAVQNRVTRLADDSLIFKPQIRDTFNIEFGVFAIVAIRLTGFGDFDVDVASRFDTFGDKHITSASRSFDGDIITLRYFDPILIDSLAGGLREESYAPSLVTNATHFENSGTITIFGQRYTPEDGLSDDVFTVTIDGLAVPVSAVPLPTPAFLLLGGLAGLAALRRRSA